MIALIVTLVIVGVVLYLVTLIPMNDIVRKIIVAVVVLVLVLWLLDEFIGIDSLHFHGRHRLR